VKVLDKETVLKHKMVDQVLFVFVSHFPSLSFFD
jgi:hypothetical protein